MTDFCLTIEGGIVPKARPRFSGGHSYLPKNYREWKEKTIGQLRTQWGNRQPIDRAEITIDLTGKFRGDLDNLAGAILDALVQAEILKDDRIACLPTLLIRHTPGKGSKTTITLHSPIKSSPQGRYFLV